MSDRLPATVDPVQLADNNVRLAGRVAVRNMERLRALLADDSGDVEVDLGFHRIEGSGRRRMLGQLAASVTLVCQRCLEPMTFRVMAQPNAILLQSGEQGGDIPPEADVLTLEKASVVLAEMIEDELLLAMPMAPMHVFDECPARRYLAGGSGV